MSSLASSVSKLSVDDAISDKNIGNCEIKAVAYTEMKGHRGGVNCIDVGEGEGGGGGRNIVTGGSDGTVRYWDERTNGCVRAIVAGEGEVTGVKAGGDGGMVYATGERGWVRCWDVRMEGGGKFVVGKRRECWGVDNVGIGEGEEVNCVAVYKDEVVVTGDDEGGVRGWGRKEGKGNWVGEGGHGEGAVITCAGFREGKGKGRGGQVG